LIGAAVAALLLLVAWAHFARADRRFADVV
jgi:hypothetical protein